MDEKAVKAGSLRTPDSGEKNAAKGPVRPVDEIERSKRCNRVSLPLVCSKQPATVALTNAKIFEIIPFP